MNKEELYMIDVSSLRLYNSPKSPSKISLLRGTFVKIIGDPIRSKLQIWVPIMTIHTPILSGYVIKKYLKKV